MSWDDIILGAIGPLDWQIDALFENQRRTWKAFRDGEASLAGFETKRLSRGGSDIVVQANPGRRKSVNAKVDPVSVSQRPCFLCLGNIPPEERGLAFDNDLVVLPNPHPILRRHLTIPTREHLPQRLNVDRFLDLSQATAPDMFVLYNGARCGASAPDHFHFQACSTAGVPLLEEMTGIKEEITPFNRFGRRGILFQSNDFARMDALIHRALEALLSIEGGDDEPLINVVTLVRDRHLEVFLFPRAKHRPDCYFAEGEDRISVSPGSLEMLGVMVVADVDHFERVDEEAAFAIYEEVSFTDDNLTKLVEAVT